SARSTGSCACPSTRSTTWSRWPRPPRRASARAAAARCCCAADRGAACAPSVGGDGLEDPLAGGDVLGLAVGRHRAVRLRRAVAATTDNHRAVLGHVIDLEVEPLEQEVDEREHLGRLAV